MRIAHSTFSGSRPGVAPHLLGANEAQLCDNCNLILGDLRAFRAPEKVHTLGLASVQSIFKYVENSNSHWVESANDIDAIKSPISNDAYERMWFTGQGQLRFFANDNISAGGFDPAVDYFKGGIPAATSAPTIARVGGAGSTYRAYFFCYLNRYGDAGANSPIGEIADYSSGRITLSAIAAVPAGRAIDRIWVYRTNSSDAGTAEFQFVLEALFFDAGASYAVGDFVVYSNQVYECTSAHSGAWNAANFSAGEAVADADLGAVFAFSEYLPPPDALSGLTALSNGVCAGFYGNTLYLSEPYKPWAYPTAYRKSFAWDIVTIKAIGTSIFVLTAGRPSRVYGQHPAAMGSFDYADFLPCLLKRTAAVWQDAVYYRSLKGLVELSSTGARLITAEQPSLAPIIDSDRWQSDFAPLHAHFYGDLYFGFNNSRSFWIDLARRYCGTISLIAQAGHISDEDGFLYLAIADGGTVYVQKWEGDNQNYLAFTWRGRLNLIDHDTNLSCAGLTLDDIFFNEVAGLIDLSTLNAAIFAGDINGALRAATLRDTTLRGDDLYALNGFSINTDVSLRLYADAVLKHAHVVGQVESFFSLPAGYLSRRWEIEISGYNPVRRVIAASSAEELMGYGD